MKKPLPPSYVNIPVSVAYAGATTTSRRLSSRRSNWPRSTFYRHLKLLREMQWIRVDQARRRIVIRPIIVRNTQMVDRQAARARVPGREPANGPGPNEELLQALADIGAENPKRSQLAGLDIDPLRVQAWQLWAKIPIDEP